MGFDFRLYMNLGYGCLGNKFKTTHSKPKQAGGYKRIHTSKNAKPTNQNVGKNNARNYSINWSKKICTLIYIKHNDLINDLKY